MKWRGQLFLWAGCCLGCGDPTPPGVTVEKLPGGIERVISNAPTDSGAWQLRALHVILPDPGSLEELLDVRSLAMDDGGTVYVSENTSDQPVKAFGPDGQFRGWIGRVGEGPGEYRVAYLAARGRDTVVVHDPQTVRTTWYGAAGNVLTFAQTACCNFGPYALDSLGRAVVPLGGRSTDSLGRRVRGWARFAPAGGPPDTIVVVHHEPEANAPMRKYLSAASLDRTSRLK